MVAPNNGTEAIRYDILVEAKIAIATMKEFLKAIEGNHAKMLAFSQLVLEAAKGWKVSWQQALGVFRQLNSEMQKANLGTLFGNVGGADLFGDTERYLSTLQATQRDVGGVTIATDGMVEATKKVKPAASAASGAIGGIAPAAKSATSGLFSLRNMARTALGTFEAMAIFFITQFVGRALKKVFDAVVQLEQAFYRLAIAEKSLSSSGVDITPTELLKIAKEITTTYATVSQIDALKMISNLAVLTKDLKLTSAEYKKLAMSIPLVAQQAGVSIESATDQVITGLTKSGRGWADLGITVDAEIIRQEAINSKLVANEEAYKALTAEQKQQVEVLALIGILEKNTIENLKEQEKYVDTVAGKLGRVNRAWEDLSTLMGTTFAPAIKFALDIVYQEILRLDVAILLVKTSAIGWLSAMIGGFLTFQDLIHGNIRSIDDYTQALLRNISKVRGQLEQEMSGSPMIPDNPTIPFTGGGDDGELENAENLKAALEKLNREILEAEIKLGQDLEDVQIDYERKLVDITIEYKQKKLDIERDYANKIADINRDYANRIADLDAREYENRQKYRNQEIEREQAYQEKLKQLREQFMMDMEEALHARDARQILKLIKNYNLQKAQAERQYKLDKENAAREEKLRRESYERERQQLEQERQQKLEDAAREREEKLAQLEADQKAEEEKAALDRAREIEDLKKHNEDRMAIIAANLVAEFNLTQENLNAILALYLQHYADVSAIYAAMQQMWMGMRMMGMGLGGPTGGPHNPDTPEGGFAEGGTLFANRPTNVMFGESGLEMATFTPIGKTGRDVNKVFSALSGGGGSNGGKIEIQLNLSPDLEARVTANTLNKTAGIITRIGRKK